MTPLAVLIVDDSADDAELMVLELRRGGYDPAYQRVDTRAGMKAALEEQTWNLILCDYVMPHFSAHTALLLYHQQELDIPFLIVSANIVDEAAISLIKLGAHDFIMKSKIAKLAPAVQRELHVTQIRRERKRGRT